MKADRRYIFRWADLGSAYGFAIWFGERNWLIPVFLKKHPAERAKQ